MNEIVKIEDVGDLIIELRNERVIADRDVAQIYGVKTKRVNEAVKNNLEKFPNDYLFETTTEEFEVLRSKFSTTKFSKTRTNPKVFTEKGLYMMATILKSHKATEATFAIIETFSKLREISRNVKELSVVDDKKEQQELIKQNGKLLTEIFDDDMKISDTETTIELNFAVVKFKYTIKKKKQ